MMSMTRAIHAVIFDWAGTTVDHGSRAPVDAMRQVFWEAGIGIHDDDLRADMGLGKRDHLAAIVKRRDLGLDVDSLHRHLERILLGILPDYAAPLPGVVDAVNALCEQGYRIGSTTGYGTAAMDLLASVAEPMGLVFEQSIAASMVTRGRPAPDMLWECAMLLGVPSAASCVAVGDTVADMEAARNAGMWAVAVVHTGSIVGLTAEQLAALPEREAVGRIVCAGDTLISAGAHMLVNGAADIGKAVVAIEVAMAQGRRP